MYTMIPLNSMHEVVLSFTCCVTCTLLIILLLALILGDLLSTGCSAKQALGLVFVTKLIHCCLTISHSMRYTPCVYSRTVDIVCILPEE